VSELRLRRATPEDAAQLAAISKRAFEGDIHYGAPGPEPCGPPGYDSPEWQAKAMGWRGATYFKLVSGNRTIGGAICFDQGEGRLYLGRIYLDPSVQNRGLGRQAMALIMAEYPAACGEQGRADAASLARCLVSTLDAMVARAAGYAASPCP